MSGLVWAAGVDLGGTKIQTIQVNAFGTIGEKIKCQTDVNGGPEAIVMEIADSIKALEKKIGQPPSAIGVGVAGQIESETGLVKFAPNLHWENVSLQKDLKRLIGVPVVVINDVRAATWGEWLYGAGKGSKNLLCIFIGTGIGGGIISDGKMLTGFNNTAGEIGHITVALDGPKCTCGNFGCMEAFAGGWALRERAKELLDKYPEKGKILRSKFENGKISGHQVTEAAKDGDDIAKEVLEMAIEALSAGVSALINTLSPQKIIFGGGVIEGSHFLIEEIEKKIKLRALSSALNNLEIESAKLHNDAGSIGAGALAIRLFLKH